MKYDRGIIKWQPFESVISSKEILTSILQEKSKIKKPILSEEEIAYIEETIIDSYYSQEIITIFYYLNGFIKKNQGKITKIDHISKMIYLNNNSKLFFNQIVKITI